MELHSEAQKRLVELVTESISQFDKSAGSVFVADYPRWIKSTKLISRFLKKYGIPISSWQVDRILRKIGNECIINFRKMEVEKSGDKNFSFQEFQEFIQNLSFPYEMIIESAVKLFKEQPFKYSFYVPLLQKIASETSVSISRDIKITSPTGFSEGFF